MAAKRCVVCPRIADALRLFIYRNARPVRTLLMRRAPLCYRETLSFASRLRLPSSVPRGIKRERVEVRSGLRLFRAFPLRPPPGVVEAPCTGMFRITATCSRYNHEIPRVFLSQRLILEMGLKDCAETLSGRISGGEKRRLSTAVQMITDPTLLFADEPTTGAGGTGGDAHSQNSTGCMRVAGLERQLSTAFCRGERE